VAAAHHPAWRDAAELTFLNLQIEIGYVRSPRHVGGNLKYL
jgi:hypothetical protein